MKEWAIPVVLGLVAAGLVWGLSSLPAPAAEPQDDAPRQAWVDGCGRRIVLVPYTDAPATLLRVGDPTQTRDAVAITDAHVDGDHLTTDAAARIVFENQAPYPCILAAGGLNGTLAPGPAERPIFDNGTVHLRFFAFDGDGLLVASNAPAVELDPWRLHPDYLPLSGAPWYFGNGTAPAGSMTLPFGASMAHDALRGLPVGAVASLHLVDHPYAWYLGDLWLTARIEALA